VEWEAECERASMACWICRLIDYISSINPLFADSWGLTLSPYTHTPAPGLVSVPDCTPGDLHLQGLEFFHEIGGSMGSPCVLLFAYEIKTDISVCLWEGEGVHFWPQLQKTHIIGVIMRKNVFNLEWLVYNRWHRSR
jgi:hypothetical protein